MSSNELFHGCGCCGHSRRDFLAGCAGCLGIASTVPNLTLPTSFAAENSAHPNSMNIRVIFSLHAPVQPGPDWPNVGFDFNPVMEKTMTALQNGCKEMNFVASMAANPEKTKEIIDADVAASNIGGYIVMQMNCWNQVIQTTVDTGKPTLFLDFLYAGSGGFLVYTAGMLRAAKPNFAHMSSGRIADVVAAANCMPLAKGTGGLKAFTDAVTKIRIELESSVIYNMGFISDEFDVLSTSDLLKELKTKKCLSLKKAGRTSFRRPKNRWALTSSAVPLPN